jgi:hypothetical protein
VWHAVPVKDLLLLLGTDAVIFVQEVQETALRLFQCRVGTSLEVAQIGENAFFKFFRVLNGAAEGLESESEASHDVST